ncbi:MAG: thioredoxin-like domain-containing protein [Bacteroidota bacterium]|jgi:thiol-disulfide isomerase/thioredoxin
MNNCFVILTLLICQLSFAQSNNFTISGKIKGLESKNISLIIFDQDFPNGLRRDSISVNNGSFTYTATVNKFLYASINPMMGRVVKSTPSGYYPAKSSTFQFFVAPGYKINFTGEISDFVDAYPFGEENNNIFGKLCKTIYPLLNKSVNLSVKIANKVVTDTNIIKRMKDTSNILNEKVNDLKVKFLRANPSLAAASWLLSDMMIRSQISNTAATEIFNAMQNEKLEGIIYYKEVAKRVEGFTATATGKMVPEISTINTFTGSKLELSSLRGKYVVLDFWGTWCGPCIAGMPKMKEYLDKYKNKMEIVGVASESDKGERWRNFLDSKPQYQWHQVLSTKEEDFILQFNVAGFPTKIIIDTQGKILGRYVGENEEIYKKLDELLK